MLGVDRPDSQLSLNSVDVLCSGKTLVGSLFGGLKAKSDIPILAKRYMDKVNGVLLVDNLTLQYFAWASFLLFFFQYFFSLLISDELHFFLTGSDELHIRYCPILI